MYSVLKKSETTATHSTPHSVTLSIPSDNQLQQAANYAVDWCNTNKMLLNASKSNAIFFSAQKKIAASQLTIKDSEVANENTVKLLGVTFDQHLRFSPHIDALIQRCRPAFHAIVKLRIA